MRRWESCFSLRAFLRTAGMCLEQVALSPVDDPQARILDRPVRHFGMRRCGRCITWCPVAIDITEEAAAIRATDVGLDADD